MESFDVVYVKLYMIMVMLNMMILLSIIGNIILRMR